ncbi:prephenate dehydratase [Streptomyces sp. NPDC056144]|uniref:prephenate dehydratase n=1 Tax=unclassified Streptomyces TaxID=2593676 RepID=UPI0035E122B2
MSIAYLGPSGSFTEAALNGLGVPGSTAVPYPTVRQALDAVRRGEAAAGVVPWENSVEGSVTESVDSLTTGKDLAIVGETLLRVEFALAVPAGGDLGTVREVVTHPVAHAQCRAWLHTHLPQAAVVTAGSTAQAARDVGASGAPGRAAIAAPGTLRRYGLEVLATGIGDRPDAVTRFVKVARPPVPGAHPRAHPTGVDRTSLVVPLADQMQHLHAVLEEFVRSKVPLTAVLSRPGGFGLGTYSFLLECEGHVDDPGVGFVVAALARRHAAFVLGSYPRADQPPRPALTTTTVSR